MKFHIPRIAPSEITPPEAYFSRRALLAGALATGASTLLPAAEAPPQGATLSYTTNAQYSVNGLALTSSSNVITTAVNGLTLNLTQPPAAGSTLQAQVTIGTDASSVTASMNTFVQSYNSLVKLEQNLTAYNASTNTASVLTGETPAWQLWGTTALAGQGH